MVSIFALCGRNQQGIGTCALSDWVAAHEDEEFVDLLYDTIENVTGKFLYFEQMWSLYSKNKFPGSFYLNPIFEVRKLNPRFLFF